MAKAPKLLMRESCIKEVTKEWERGKFLEIGAGTGYMTRLFLDRQFYGACYDLGDESRRRLRQNLTSYSTRIQVVDTVDNLPKQSFDYLFAFEVLEHIDNDIDTLIKWTHYLKSSGKILISVPAHQSKFSKTDEIVGHVRRYEKDGLYDLLKQAGYKKIHIMNYGYPITEVSRLIGNFLLHFSQQNNDLSPVEKSIKSSYTRPQNIRTFLSCINERFITPFIVVQRLFYRYDLGDGYIAFAEKI